MQPLVSIIIPCYNVSKTISKTLDSIIKQTYPNIEVVLVNDCSTDNTLEIVNKYHAKIKQLKVVTNTTNKMALYCRLYGVKISKGELVTFIDGDDWFTPKAIELLVNNYLKTNADVVCGSWKFTFDNYGIIANKPWNIYYAKPIERVYNEHEFEEAFSLSFFGKIKFPVVNWAKLYKKSLYSEEIFEYLNKNPRLIKSNDLFQNLLVFRNVKSVSFTKDVLIYYRYGGGSQKIVLEYSKDINTLYLLRMDLLKNHPKKEEALTYMMPELDFSYYLFLVDCVYLNKLRIAKVKEIYDGFCTNEAFQDMYAYRTKSNSDNLRLFDALQNNQLTEAEVIIKNEIKKFGFKRDLKSIVSKFLASI